LSEENLPIQWTEEQWRRVNQVVHDEAHKTRVAASFLPLFGPLPADAATVATQAVGEPAIDYRQRGEAEFRLTVDDRQTMGLTTISANVYLRRHQVAQEDLSSALIMFRRSANIIARVEDAIIFNGLAADGKPAGVSGLTIPEIYSVTTGEAQRGLLDAVNETVEIPSNSPGSALVRPVVEAITRLENDGHLGPFALSLGNLLYGLAYDPEPHSLVLPADRIKPLLDGPLLRSSTLPPDEGVIVSLAGEPIDLVVASEIATRYLQVTPEPRHLFRISQRIALRVKQPQAVVTLRLGES
jgi:uncharacterized linocin/CFP29 family protein